MTCGGRSWAGPERGSEILCVLTHGMGSTPPHHHHVVKGSCGGVFGFEAVLCMMLWDVVSDVW